MRYIVSACLAGVACRHDGRHSRDEEVVWLVREGRARPSCPEQLGGLSTPRPPAELRMGDGGAVLRGEASVVDHAGRNVTDLYMRGAIEFYRLARTCGQYTGWGAVLFDYDIDGRIRSGRGVAAALLEGEGLQLLRPSALRRKQPGEGTAGR